MPTKSNKFMQQEMGTRYIIPANVKHFRNWAISYIILKKLESMKPEFPRVKIDSSEFIIG